LILIHVMAGLAGILSGFAAMSFAKGSRRHRLAGDAYVISMLLMCASALVIAIFLRPSKLNVLAAMLTSYLVVSAWMTMHRRPEAPGMPEWLASLLGAGTVVTAITFLFLVKNGFTIGFCILFGTIAALSVTGDIRLFLRRSLTGTQKLVRHIWRMCFSLWVAAASFFLGQARHLPDWFTGAKLNVILVLLVLGLMVYWLIRVRRPPWTRAPRAADRAPVPAP
jgi:uncharacterized membrane protein